MVKEELGQKAQVLTVDGILRPIDLKDCNFILLVSIDLVAGWVKERTVLAMPFQLLLEDEKAETELA